MTATSGTRSESEFGHSLDSRRLVWIAWSLLAGLVAVDFVRVLAGYSWVYTDFDQVLQWTAAHELLGGSLHEPRFYGQAYNSMVEGWTAAPLVALGLPYPIAVPLVTAVLSLAPFLALSLCALRLRRPLAALAVIALPLALPLPFAMLSTMPRGFVPGLCLASLAAAAALRRPLPGPPALHTFGVVLALALSVSLNPNAAVIAGPMGLLLLLRQGRSRTWLRTAALGLAVGALLHWLSVVFYAMHPEHVIYGHRMPGLLQFGWRRMVEAWANAGRWLDLVSPALPGGVLWLGAVVVALLVLLSTRDRLARRAAVHSAVDRADDAFVGPDAATAWALAAAIVFVLATLGLERVHVGSESLFWPLSRSYLGVPALLALVVVRADRSRLDDRRLRPLVLVILLLGAGAFYLRGTQLDATVERELGVTNPVGVRPWPVRELEARCRALDELATRHDARLVAVGSFEIALTYACEPLIDGDWGTLLVRTKGRRTWRILEELDRGPRAALLYGFNGEQMARLRAAGHEMAPAGKVAGQAVWVLALPGGMDGFAALADSGLPHARGLHERALRLQAAEGR